MDDVKEYGVDGVKSEANKTDYLSVARLILSTISKRDTAKMKYWTEIIERLTRINLIKQIRELTDPEIQLELNMRTLIDTARKTVDLRDPVLGPALAKTVNLSRPTIASIVAALPAGGGGSPLDLTALTAAIVAAMPAHAASQTVTLDPASITAIISALPSRGGINAQDLAQALRDAGVSSGGSSSSSSSANPDAGYVPVPWGGPRAAKAGASGVVEAKTSDPITPQRYMINPALLGTSIRSMKKQDARVLLTDEELAKKTKDLADARPAEEARTAALVNSFMEIQRNKQSVSDPQYVSNEAWKHINQTQQFMTVTANAKRGEILSHVEAFLRRPSNLQLLKAGTFKDKWLTGCVSRR